MDISMLTEKNLEVYKSNALTEASYRLTSAEQGIILSCISHIRKDEEITDQTMYTVSVADYTRLTGADPKSAYRDIKNAAQRLRKREVKIFHQPNGKGKVLCEDSVLITGWVQSVRYSKKHGEVTLRFSHDMLPYLTNLTKCFTKYRIKNVSQMSSTYGIRLYELLTQWKNFEKREVSIDWLKKIFLLENKYNAIKDFKKYVLEPAIHDINKHSDLWVKWSQRKTGRKVTHLSFNFGLKCKGSNKVKKNNGRKIYGVSEFQIERDANPGESYERAAARISNEKVRSKNIN